jgi:hypothetical protein
MGQVENTTVLSHSRAKENDSQDGVIRHGSGPFLITPECADDIAAGAILQAGRQVLRKWNSSWTK